MPTSSATSYVIDVHVPEQVLWNARSVRSQEHGVMLFFDPDTEAAFTFLNFNSDVLVKIVLMIDILSCI